ncbi:MAG TPA: nitroreductase family protein [Candidatus Izemoplasmatales bacterium]|nr:nitroreductase family protein [Candidatus Izemoplasmatales bacterium]
MNQTIQTILKRRSIRSYLDKPIPDTDVKTIVKAALYAPSAKNKQDWHFTVISKKDTIDKMSDMAIEGMKRLGLHKDGHNHIFYHAPLVIVLSSKIAGFSGVNVGCAVENMALAAQAMGYGSCIIGQTRYMYHKANKVDVDKLLKIPDGYEHDVAICFGYPDGDAPEPKVRKENIVDYIL